MLITRPRRDTKVLVLIAGLIALWVLLYLLWTQAPSSGISPSSFVDWLIRNQIGLIALLGVLLSYVVRSWARGHSFRGRASTRGVSRYAPGILALLTLGLVGLFAFTSPIPATAGLGPPYEWKCARQPFYGTIVLVHGWNGGPGSWHSLPSLLCADSRFKDVRVLTVNYPTFMARRNLRIPQLAEWLNDNLIMDSIWEHSTPVIFIAHSMGGLVAREIALLRKISDQEPAPALLVEIGTPHQGAAPAGLAAALGISKQLTEEMVSGSSFLTRLRTQWQSFAGHPRTRCFGSPQDRVVTETSATSDCDWSRSYPQWDHRELVDPKGEDDQRYKLPVHEVWSVLSAESK